MLVQTILQSLPAVLVSVLVAAVLTLAFSKIQQNRKIRRLGGRAKEIKSWSFGIGNVLRMVKFAKQDKNREFWEMGFKDAGANTVEFTILGRRVIQTADPENIKAVLATQFHDYGKGEFFHDSWYPFLGDSIFSTDGKLWHDSRALIRTQFIKERVADLHTFERHIQHLFQVLPMDGSTFDMNDMCFRFTLDTATDFLLGGSVNAIENPKHEFSRAFQDIQSHQNTVTRVGPLWRLLSTRKLKKDLKILNDFVEPFVQRTLMINAEQLKDKKDTEYNFLHALAQFTRDPRMLRDQLVAVLIAARDTTAGTLSWAFYELSKKPEVVKKLRAEILGTLGPDGVPTYEDLKSMKYLSHVINETLRLYPAVPFNIRVSLKDTTLPRGNANNENAPIGISEGTGFAYSTLVMQRRADLFGPDVNEFRPERWETGPPKSWHYVPFNGGPRICVGQQFALTEMQYFMSRMLQRYETIECRFPKDHVQKERCEITITPSLGTLVGMKPAVYN